jgi:hypothetical protein
MPSPQGNQAIFRSREADVRLFPVPHAIPDSLQLFYKQNGIVLPVKYNLSLRKTAPGLHIVIGNAV